MKKLLFWAITTTILSAPAIATQMCTRLLPLVKRATFLLATNTVDWKIFDNSIDDLTYTIPSTHGVAICSSATNTNSDGTLPIIASTAEYQNIVHCWGRMIKPIVSEWFYYKTYDTAVACLNECAFTISYMGIGFDMQEYMNQLITGN